MDELEYFPDSSVPTAPSMTSISIPNLAAELESSSPELVAGEEGRAILVLRNTGLAKIEFHTDSVLVGRVLNTLREPVGTDDIAVAGMSTMVLLAYKQELEIPVVFNTSSHLNVEGRIPPGEYLLGVRLPIYNDGEGSYVTRVIEVAPIELRVLAR